MKTVNIGELFLTKGVRQKADENSYFFYNFLFESIERYSYCDWGDTCEEDKQVNNEALENGGRILAVYIYPKDKTKIWIITDQHEEGPVTTVLFPDEY